MTLAADRAPVSTYEQAIWWLIGEWVNHPDFLRDDGPLPPEGRLACDMFWVTERQLRADVIKRWREMFHERPGVQVLPVRGKIKCYR